MSSYKSFAIVGFGTIGSLILDEFLKSEAGHPGNCYKLRVLTRFKDKPELAAYSSKGVDITPVDYTSPQSIASALTGVDVVLSSLRDDGLDLQKSVVRAAKVAGVKLFVPSEYGRNTLGDTSEYLKPKAETHKLLKELALPYTLLFTGMWPENLFADSIGPYLGVDFEAGKFALFGEGRTPLSWTSPRSIAPFVHYVLTTLPAAQLENRAFSIEGDRKSFRDIIAVWEAKHGRQAQVTVRTPEEIKKFQDEQTAVALKFVSDAWRDGSLQMSAEDNALWPEWKPLSWADLMP